MPDKVMKTCLANCFCCSVQSKRASTEALFDVFHCRKTFFEFIANSFLLPDWRNGRKPVFNIVLAYGRGIVSLQKLVYTAHNAAGSHQEKPMRIKRFRIRVIITSEDDRFLLITLELAAWSLWSESRKFSCAARRSRSKVVYNI